MNETPDKIRYMLELLVPQYMDGVLIDVKWHNNFVKFVFNICGCISILKPVLRVTMEWR